MPMRISGMNSGLDTEAMVQELVSAYKKKGEKTTKAKTKFEWKQEALVNINKKIKAFNKKVQNLKFQSSFNFKKTTSSNESKASVIAGDNAVKGTQSLEVEELAQAKYITSGKLETNDGSELSANTKLSQLGDIPTDGRKIVLKNNQTGNTVAIDITEDTTIGELVDRMKSNGIEASFDANNGRLFLSAKQTGEKNSFELYEGYERTETDAEGNYDKVESSVLNNLLKVEGPDASIKQAKNAKIILNDAEFESDTNNFNINGLSITAKEKTNGEVLTLTTDNDSDALYKQIKGIVKEYSELINELDKLYNADLAKGYEPLTDEEKDAMSDKEVEKWEEKIKDSLLRRDSNISSVSRAMKESAMQGYTINGKKMTLSDFGINTLGYFLSGDNEKNALHIDGDEDDENVSGNTNKLKKMISDDPEAVGEFFSAFMTDLSDRLTKLSASSTERTYGNFYDDKKVASDLTKYEKKVSDWEEYVKKIEDKYYKMFSNMEKQLSKLNSTQQSLSNYFGGGM